MSPPDNEPPPDGGPVLFAISYLVPPVMTVGALAARFARPGYRLEAACDLSLLLAPTMVGAIWAYFSRTHAAVVTKAAVVGAVVVLLPIVKSKMDTAHIQHDDVLPLFFFLVAPFLVLGGAVLGAASGAAALMAFSQRQHARLVWLSGVAAGNHPRYCVIPLTREDSLKPPFLRYRDGDAGLAVRTDGEYRSGTGPVVIARVPRSRG